MRPQDDLSEEDVTALFDQESGDLKEPEEEGVEEDSTDSEESEEDATEETGSEDKEEEIDWAKVDPRYKTAFEKAMSDANKWKSDHGKIQAKWTEHSKSSKEQEKTLNELRQRADELGKWESLLERNPRLAEVVQKEIERSRNPLLHAEVPDYLQKDPAFQYVQKTVAPLISNLQQQIQELSSKASKIDSYEAKDIEARNRSLLDTQLNAAKEQVKSIFGRDATEDEVTQVLEYMVENKFFGNGKAAALAVFQDQYEKAARTRWETEQSEKAKKFPVRNKTVNPNRAAHDKNNARSPEEAIQMALADQGIGS